MAGARVRTGSADRRRGASRVGAAALALIVSFGAPARAQADDPAPKPLHERLLELPRLTAPDSDCSAAQLLELAYEVDEARAAELSRGAKAEALPMLADALHARGFDAPTCTSIDAIALHALCADARLDEAEAFAAGALARAPERSVFTGILLTEAGDMRRVQGRYRDALEHLEAAREHFAHVERDPESAPAHDRVWFGVHLGVVGESWLGLGLPDVAAEAIEMEGAIARADRNGALARSYHDHRIKLAQSLEDNDRLASAVEAAARDELLARAPDAWRARLEVRRLQAQVEAERSGAPRGEAERIYRALLDATALDEFDRHEAHVHAAFGAFDRGDFAACREAMARARASPLHDLDAATGPAPEYEACLRGLELEMAARTAPDELPARAAALSASFERFLEWWRASPERAGGVGFLAFHRRRYVVDVAIEGARISVGELEGPRRALEALMAAQACGSLTQALHAATPDVDSARAALTSDRTLVLSFAPGRSRSHALALHADGAAHFALPPRAVVEAARRELEAQCGLAVRRGARWGDPALAPSAAALRDALLPPALLELVEKHEGLVIVGLDSLGYTPFEILAGAGGEPLGWTHAVSYAPSIAAAAHLAERARSSSSAPRDSARTRTPWIVAPAMDERCLAGLGLAPFVAPSAGLARIADAWNGAARRIEGSEATFAAISSLDTSLLHLITHGHFDRRRELPAAVLLAGEDGACEPWWSEDVARSNAPPIVVLTACGAGRGPRRRGDDGRASFAGQFLSAGANAVVLAHTDLELHGALELGAGLHRELAAGTPLARALTHARRELARQPRELALQHLLTHVFGNGAARVEATPPPRADSNASPGSLPRTWLAALAIAAIACGAALWRLNRRRSAPVREPASGGSSDAR